MLHVTGKVLGVVSETVKSPTGAFADFVATTIHLLDGMESDAIRVGRDFDRATLNDIKEGDLLDLKVSIFKGNTYAEKIIQRVPAGHKAPANS